jgi:hypothetical protein
MIADLTDAMDNLERTYKFMTYRSVLFPAPAVRIIKGIRVRDS